MRFCRPVGAVALLLLSLCAVGTARADSVGDARQLSRLGEPLRLSIPVRPDGGPPVQEACLAVVPPPQSDGLAHILTANVVVERQGAASTITVSTASPVREPVVRVLLRTSCDGASRSYAVFLEPPGSTRQVRAVAQPGPRVPASAAAPAPASGNRASPAPGAATDGAPGHPLVTVIPVMPGRANAAANAGRPVAPGATPGTAPSRSVPAAATPNAATRSAMPDATTRPVPAPLAPPAMVGAATPPPAVSSEPIAAAAPAATERAPDEKAADPEALEAENQDLRAKVAELNGELARLQQVPPPAPPRTASPALRAPRWELAWPVVVALIGLAALVLGGFMWRRRHAPDEWPLTGPPSHRLASRTSLAEEPVPFRPSGVDETIKPELAGAGSAPVAPRAPVATANTPTALLVQPSADELGRDLEQELFIAERAHSALERAHPDLVEALTRSWGTASARAQLGALLAPSSPELMRMSGEATAELRLLMRIADDLAERTNAAAPATQTFGRPAPAW